MKRIEDILAACIDDIDTGRKTFEQCLESYEPLREQIEPLLKIAIGVKDFPTVKPSPAFKGRTKASLMEYIHEETVSRNSRQSILSNIMWPALNKGVLRTTIIAISVLLIILTSGTGIAFAAQDSLPGGLLYPVKGATENIRLWLETDAAGDSRLELGFADVRIKEIEKLLERASDKTAIAIDGYQNNIEISIEKALLLADMEIHSSLLEQIALTIETHMSTLDHIEDISEVPASPITETRDIATGGQIKALHSLSYQEAFRANEINIRMMNTRLQRAENATIKGQPEKAEEALSIYARLYSLNEDIYRIAQDSRQDISPLNELNTRTFQHHVRILEGFGGKISEKAAANIDSVVEKIRHSYGKDLPPSNSSTRIPGEGTGNQPEDAGQQTPEPGDHQQEPGSQQEPGDQQQSGGQQQEPGEQQQPGGQQQEPGGQQQSDGQQQEPGGTQEPGGQQQSGDQPQNGNQSDHPGNSEGKK